jgi:NADH-quinone oxidoreductase subunit G
MPTIFIENRPYEVKPGRNLLHAVLSLGFNLPYFCWHPVLGSVGACRQCAVKVFRNEDDKKGQIVMACMTPVTDGVRLSIEDEEARLFRASVIEWLMLNHPHDCPVCDEGGECHLQDMTVMTGHTYRRTRFPKRTYRNQDLGPFINHEMNRCIQCYRCVRLYRDYGGGRDFDVFGAHDHVYFGRHESGVLSSPFSGNLVEVCPTGVFTDKSFKTHFTRKWDLQTAPSVCVHCGLGCNTIPGERYGALRRIRNRYHGEVNGYFLCDRGRYGYGFVNGPRRIREPLKLGRPVVKEEAFNHVKALVQNGGSVIGIGSPRASLEANFALRTLVGAGRFYAGFSAAEARVAKLMLRILQEGPAAPVSLREAAEADAVLVLGEDVTNTAPMLALSLRQASRTGPIRETQKLRIPSWDDAAVREALQERRGPFFIATPQPTPLDEIATRVYRAAPADCARLGFAVAHLLDANAPTSEHPLAGGIADALRAASHPLIVAGIGCGSDAVLQAAANTARALGVKGRLCLTAPECNTLGVVLLGGGDLSGLQADTVIILENDLSRRGSTDMLLSAKHVVAIDHTANATTEKAEVVLPAATFAEATGTLVNNELRAQRFYQVFEPEGEVRASWRWLSDLLPASWKNEDEVLAALAAELPVFAAVPELAPPAGFRICGRRAPRMLHRASGRTAMHADITVHEPQPPADPDSPLAFSMEGYEGMGPSALFTHFWAPRWNSIQSLNRFQEEVGGPLRGGDPGRRLLSPEKDARPAYYSEIPGAFERREGQFFVVPLYCIFGSEELSALSPGVADLAPKPYVAMHPDDAAADEVSLTIAGKTQRLPVKRLSDLPRGVAGLPVGLPGSPAVELPAWSTISS